MIYNWFRLYLNNTRTFHQINHHLLFLHSDDFVWSNCLKVTLIKTALTVNR